MSYSIQSESFSVLKNPKIQLPRFQRRGVWDDKQNFKLCISIFKDYPIGVMIINKIGNSQFLLDGRQRQNAIIKMCANPVNIYNWASKFIPFGKNCDTDEIIKVFWPAVENYIRSERKTKTITAVKKDEYGEDLIDKSDLENDDDETDYGGSESEDYSEDSFLSKSEQKKNLGILLKLILMVHKVEKGLSRWERAFDFREYSDVLPYVYEKLGKSEIDGEKLRKVIVEDIYEGYVAQGVDDKVTEDYFIEYCCSAYKIPIKKKEKFVERVSNNWEYLSECIEILARANEIFTEAKIGIIWLRNASTTDTLNIFSLINSGGTQLKAEELLSAKPYWNELAFPSMEVTKLIDNLYANIGIRNNGKYVKWDIPATLLSRIDKNNLIFKKYDDSKVEIEKITLGFKLLSAYYFNGISAKAVSSFEYNEEDIFKNMNTIDKFVFEINKMLDLLLEYNYFECLNSWKKSIDELMGNAVAIEFLIILYREWKDRKCPQKRNDSNTESFIRDSLILIDRLIYEYTIRTWKGSGDSVLGTHLKEKNRFIKVELDDWTNLLNSVNYGSFNGQKTNVKLLTPIIYHTYCLRGMSAFGSQNTVYEVDHIMPQNKFKGNSVLDENLKNSLGNLSLLPRKKNESKSNKLLRDLSSDLKKSVSKYSNIPIEKFEYYSDVNNLEEMIQKRIIWYLETFDKFRNGMFANLEANN